MKYFLDTEFIEGYPPVRLWGIKLPSWLAKRQHTIQLISIAIVAEDGREYYAISNEFNADDADDWVKKNVIAKLPERYPSMHDSPRMREEAWLWKSNYDIARDIITFINGGILSDLRSGLWPDMEEVKKHNPNQNGNAQPDIYAYYADYDWVVFASLWGRMIDLPDGFPMYCRDLKQMLDEKAEVYDDHFMNGDEDFNWKLKVIINKSDYPKQENEHNALDDARWNFKLFNFIQSL